MAIRDLVARVLLQIDRRTLRTTEKEIQDALAKGTNPARAKKNLDETDAGLKKLTNRAKELAGLLGVAVLGEAVRRFVTSAVRDFAEFDSKMNQSTAIMGNVSDAMRADMAAVSKAMAVDLNIPAAKLAEGFFFLASSGLDAAGSIKALPVVAQFAKAGMTDLAKATEMLLDGQNALGLASSDAAENMANLTRVSDVLVKGNIVANASVEQLATSLSRKSAAAMRLNNIEVEEGVAVLAAFAAQGLKGEVAGEMFSRFLTRMTAAYRDNTKAWKDSNVEILDAQGNFLPLADIVDKLTASMDGLTPVQASAKFAMLGLTTEAADAIKPLLGTGEAIRGYHEALKEAGGSTQLIADNQMKALSERVGALREDFNNFKIDLGEVVAAGAAAGGALGDDEDSGLTGSLKRTRGWLALNKGAVGDFTASLTALGILLLNTTIGIVGGFATGLNVIANILTGTIATAAAVASGAFAMFVGVLGMVSAVIAKFTGFGDSKRNPVSRFFREMADSANEDVNKIIGFVNRMSGVAGDAFTMKDLRQGYDQQQSEREAQEQREFADKLAKLRAANAARLAAANKKNEPGGTTPPAIETEDQREARLKRESAQGDFRRDLGTRVIDAVGSAADVARKKIDDLRAKAVEVFGKNLPADIEAGLRRLDEAASDEELVANRGKEFDLMQDSDEVSDAALARAKEFVEALRAQEDQVRDTKEAHEELLNLIRDAEAHQTDIAERLVEQRAEQAKRAEEAWSDAVDAMMEKDRELMNAFMRTAHGVQNAWEDAFGLILQGGFTMGRFMTVLGRQMGAALLGGLAQYAGGKVAENIASGFEQLAKAAAAAAAAPLMGPMAGLALTSAAMHKAAAGAHFASAGKWAVLAGAAGAGAAALGSAGGGGGGGAGRNLPRNAQDAGADEVEDSRRTGPTIIFEVHEFDPMNPRAQERLAIAQREWMERAGGTVEVRRNTG